jgi:hypothetical protein
MGTENYRWRVPQDLHTELRRAGRLRKMRISVIIETVVREWLKAHGSDSPDEIE